MNKFGGNVAMTPQEKEMRDVLNYVKRVHRLDLQIVRSCDMAIELSKRNILLQQRNVRVETNYRLSQELATETRVLLSSLLVNLDAPTQLRVKKFLKRLVEWEIRK